MGCDIHAHVELKIDGKWHHYSDANVDRSYRMFAKLAGVRGEPYDGSSPIAKGRGIPEDISLITYMDLEQRGHGGHSHSWITGKEAEDLETWLRKMDRGYTRPPFGYIFGNSLDRPDVRVVFWFDN